MVNGKRVSWIVGFLLPLALPPATACAQQLFKGPAQGTSDPGEQVSTVSFPPTPTGPARAYAPLPPHSVPLLPAPADLTPPLAPIGFNEQTDRAAFLAPPPGTRAPSLLSDFEGIPMTNSIPPDPIIAAGPSHLMPLVNRDFAIFEKSGLKLQQIHAPDWFDGVSPGNNAADPKVIYDHFADRWVMVWLSVDATNEVSHILVSVSDDEDPNGAWCNWALPGNQNGATTVGNWSDYQGLGFDESAVYVVPNQFTFSDFTFAYVKVRILPKTTLYDTDCPAIDFTDLWDLRDPDELTVPVVTVRPAVTFGSPGVEYLVSDSRFIQGTYMTLWEVTNPTSATPGLDATNVPTTEREIPPNAGQLGGSTVPIDVGGPRVRNLVYRDGSVWTAHSVASASGQFARARYVRIEVMGLSVLEDVSFGSEGCWLYYPALTVGAGGHMTMVYSQSCLDEFVSVRFTGRAPTDTDLQVSALLKAGEASYEIAVGNPPRVRWGDYSGVAVDPSAPDRVWIFGEYAESEIAGTDRWGTWIGQTDPRAPGDINGDDNVDVADLTLLIDFILERQSPSMDEETFADCNQDSGLDIGDVVCMVNVILSTPPQTRLAAAILPGSSTGGPLQARLSERVDGTVGSARTLLLELDPATGVAAAHARLAYDATRTRIGSLDLAAGAGGFQLAYHDAGGELTLVLYSLDGHELNPAAGPIVRIPFEILAIDALHGETFLELREMTLADRAGTVRKVVIDEVQVTALPHQFQLSEVFPNPIGPSSGARLLLDIPEAPPPALSSSASGRQAGGAVRVRVDVYNVRGQRIRSLMDADLSAGQHTIEWDGTNERGTRVGAGLYVVRVNAGREFSAVRKLIVSH